MNKSRRMDPAQFVKAVEDLRRRRVPAPLFRSFPWYRALDAERRYQVEERIAICVENGPVTPEAWLLAREEVGA